MMKSTLIFLGVECASGYYPIMQGISGGKAKSFLEIEYGNQS
jgi:hypothetical protein